MHPTLLLGVLIIFPASPIPNSLVCISQGSLENRIGEGIGKERKEGEGVGRKKERKREISVGNLEELMSWFKSHRL